MRTKIVLLLFFLFGALVSASSARPIFSEKRPDGSVVFTDKPKDQNASVKMNLPPLERYTPLPGDPSNMAPATCYAHGGADCTVGPDADGSVICTDGFRDVRARFNLECREAKLVINNAEYHADARELKVFIRNSSQVPAQEVVVFIQQRGAKKVISNTLKQIEAFGIGEIVFNDLILLENIRERIVDNLVVSCQNCG